MNTSLAATRAASDRRRTTSRILLVDDDPAEIALMSRILADLGDLSFATSGAASLRLARESAPDLILLDAEMPGVSGFQVCQALKADSSLADVPVIFVTSHGDIASEVAGFESGAADFIAKPVNAAQVRARVKAQLHLKAEADLLRLASTTDALTCIANRRRFDEALDQEWRRARRAAEPLALLMIDVDHFKLYNDHYGHVAGDECLRAVAHAIVGASARPGDLASRYGGEEFMVLLPETSRIGGRRMALAIADAVRALGIAHAASTTADRVTISVGVACYDEGSAWWVDAPGDSRLTESPPRCCAIALVQAADSALYAAKRAGRARACLLDIADVDAPHRVVDVGTDAGHRLSSAPVGAP